MAKQRQAFKNKNNTQRENLKTSVEENLKISEKFCPLQICLPIHSGMSESDARYSIKKLIDVY
jgi:dTDP-4-amino-4,6-dideoxygalactose transaminase